MSRPERLDRFMARANAAYYGARDPFADFTTAPEISQVFGELLGAWTVVVWRSMGSPAGFLFAEAGPGRGTLMADALRLIGRLAPACAAALRLVLIETSPRLRALQQAALSRVWSGEARWCETSSAIPDGPMILLANEFLDALPIRQFRREPDGWTEHHVADGGCVWLAGPPPPGAGVGAPTGGVVEICEAALDWTLWLDQRLAEQGGAALLLDYGADQAASGDSLQALRNGAPVAPHVEAGTADLTAHVDFVRLRDGVRHATCLGPVSQGRFLASLGLFERTAQLASGLSPEGRQALYRAAHRLADPGRMGHLFKAMALSHPGLPAPPGFESGPLPQEDTLR